MMEPNSNRLYNVGRDTNSSNSSAYYNSRPDVTTPGRKLVKTTGSLEIIEGKDSGMCGSFDSSVDSRPSSSGSQRPWSRGSVGSIPPRSDSSMSRRVYTPTKQIALQAVRRKEESSEPFVDHIDWRSASLDTSHRKTWSLAEEGQGDADRAPVHHFMQNSDVEQSQHATKLRLPIPSQMEEQEAAEKKQNEESERKKREMEMNGVEKQKDNDDNNGEKDNEDDDDDSDSSDDDDEEEEERKAPNELLMEFVDCLMRKDFTNASKLCKMILLYEPENAEALKFQPLIEEKLALDEEAAKEAEEEGSDDDEDDDEEDDSDDDDDDDDDSDDDNDSSSDEDSSDNDNIDIGAGGDNNQNNGRNVVPANHPRHFHRSDSGIASDTEP